MSDVSNTTDLPFRLRAAVIKWFRGVPVFGRQRRDIIDRLRLDADGPPIHPGYYRQDLIDAADEIERRRALPAGHIEVRREEDGSLDEIVATGASVHLEQMDSNAWWISIEAGGRMIHVNLTTPRTVITARCDYVG